MLGLQSNFVNLKHHLVDNWSNVVFWIPNCRCLCTTSSIWWLNGRFPVCAEKVRIKRADENLCKGKHIFFPFSQLRSEEFHNHYCQKIASWTVVQLELCFSEIPVSLSDKHWNDSEDKVLLCSRNEWNCNISNNFHIKNCIKRVHF